MAKKEKAAPVEGMCGCTGCKGKESRFGFCESHFDEYKFGLITKRGERVSDYDKKIDHYRAYQEKKRAGKAA